VILGPQAKREIAAEPNRYDGDGFAKAGLILGWVNIGLMVLFIGLIVLVAIFSEPSTTSSYESLTALAT